MKIAVISITYNDGYKIKEWKKWYDEYKNEVYLHIIVDNGSDEEYFKELYEYFPTSVILQLGYNGGCTGAYNFAIDYALKDTNVDAIVLLGNDIRMPKGEMTKLYQFLYEDISYGMVYPLLLNSTSSKQNPPNYGYVVDKKKLEMEPVKNEDDIYSSNCGPGGCNMAKPLFYRKVGLQDGNLFMYFDEVDMALRTEKVGLKMATTSNVHAWHMHINKNGGEKRFPLAAYLLARNRIYLAKKHFGVCCKIKFSLYGLYCGVSNLLSKGNVNRDALNYNKAYLRGVLAGILNNMSNRF